MRQKNTMYPVFYSEGMTISLPAGIAIAALMLFVGILSGYLFAQTRAQHELANLSQELVATREKYLLSTGRADQLEQENDNILETYSRDSAVLQAISPLVKQLDQISHRIQDLEQHTISGHTKVLTQLTNDARIHAELSRNTASLNSALRSTSARGMWGEIQLRRIIEAAGMLEHVDFDVQVSAPTSSMKDGANTSSARLRPDVIIHLPGGAHIPIDAKVPMSAYLQAQELDEGDLTHAHERTHLLKEHAKALQTHVNALIKRNYPQDYPDSPQLTVLFLPADSLLAEALMVDPSILEDSFAHNIVLATPSTLFALLRSLGTVWSSAAASVEARDVINLGKTLVQRISVVVKHLNSLGKSLGNSVVSYNKAISSLESRLLVTARSFDSIPIDALELSNPAYEIPIEHAQTSKFVSPELNM